MAGKKKPPPGPWPVHRGIARLVDQAESKKKRGKRSCPGDPCQDEHGQFCGCEGGGGGDSAGGGGGGGQAQPITQDEARGDSRPVTAEQFQQLAGEGEQTLSTMAANSSPPTGLNDRFDAIKADAFQAVQQPWGGATYDAHTGQALTSNDNAYALSVKPPDVSTVSIPENATSAQFSSAMDQAQTQFAEQLAQQNGALGVFHDDSLNRIDIDPVTVVNSVHDVETVGAFTHAIGGAYSFADGNGYFPPHVAEAATAPVGRGVVLPLDSRVIAQAVTRYALERAARGPMQLRGGAMPYVVVRDEPRCPVGRPWAVKKQGTDRTYGCHPTEDAAQAQQRALYAKESQATSEVPMPVNTITDAKDLLAAIGSAGRAGDPAFDEVRREIIERARELGHADLVPDNWEGDGTLADRAGVWRTEEEHRSYDELFRGLSAALAEQVDGWSRLLDFDRDQVQYLGEGCLYSASYTLADDGISLGDPHRVRSVTSYVAPEVAERKQQERKVELRHTIAARKKKAESLKRGEIERRMVPSSVLALRQANAEVRDGDDAPVKLLEFDGYASIFNRGYKVGQFEETMATGAFKRSLSNANLDCVLRTEHNGLPLARTTGSITLTDGTSVPTLQLSEDDKGLHVRALLDPRDPDVDRLKYKYQRGDLKEMSFAFRCLDDDWSDDYSQRTVHAADIHRGDVSIVTYGSSPTTSSSLRSEEAVNELRDLGEEGIVGALQEFALQWIANYRDANGDALERALEERQGKVISSTSMQTLQTVLGLVANADDAVDTAIPLLADLMGVPNPDADDDDDDDGDGDDDDDDGRAEVTEAEIREFWEGRRDFTSKQRQTMAKNGTAMPDGSFPIANVQDLKNAIQAVGRASDPAAAKAHIKKRAAALNASNLIPDSWRSEDQALVLHRDAELELEALMLRTAGGRR